MGSFDDIHAPSRAELIARIAKALENCTDVNPGWWAFIWLSDMAQLESYADWATTMDSLQLSLIANGPTFTDVLRLFASQVKYRDESAPSTTDPATPSITPGTVVTEDRGIFTTSAVIGKRPRSQSPRKLPAHSSIERAGPSTTSPASRSRSRDQSRIPRMQSHAATSPIRTSRSSPRSPRIVILPSSLECLLTKMGQPLHIAHFHSYSLDARGDHNMVNNLWKILRLFFSKEKVVDQWHEAVRGNKMTEKLENSMTLSANAHGLWDNSTYALKPLKLSEDRKELTVEIHWLPKGQKGTRHSLVVPPVDTPELDCASDGSCLFDCLRRRVLSPKEPITFTTKDPDNLPLPSFELLEMRWILTRLIAMSGAADITDEELDPDNRMGLAPPIPVDDELIPCLDLEGTEEAEEGPSGEKRKTQGSLR
ncbi:hypothetical protein BJX70DRAFT_394641 [Aspergillus crustosus]